MNSSETEGRGLREGQDEEVQRQENEPCHRLPMGEGGRGFLLCHRVLLQFLFQLVEELHGLKRCQRVGMGAAQGVQDFLLPGIAQGHLLLGGALPPGAVALALQLGEDGPGPLQNLLRDAGQLCHLDAVAPVRPAGEDLPQEDDLVPPGLHGDVEVGGAGELPFQLRELVVVGGEEGPGPQGLAVGAVFQHRLGKALAVKGGGAPADLIQDEKALGGGLPQDLRDLAHLHHEGGAAAGEVVAGADAGEDPVN